MSHNNRYKPGPTLEECEKQGVTHLRLHCNGVNCGREVLLDLYRIRARKNVPVNYIRWRCDPTSGGCGGFNISVSAVKPAPEEIPHPIFDLKKVKVKPRRKLRYF
jgi:hypothetical protein